MANINLSGTINHESQSKILTQRINLLEGCMGNLCENFGKIARKNARLRDTSDHLVSVINEYSGKEQINSSSKRGLVNYSSYLSALEDYRHAMIERVEKKIIQPISKYQEYLKSTKKEIKSTIKTRDLEKKKQQQLNNLMQRKPDDGRNIAQAQANAENAAEKVSTQDKILAEVIDKLEQKKLNDMKNILKDFTHIQLIFHAKALEMLSTAYKYLLEIDTESDLEEFRNNFTQSTINNLQYSSNKSLNESSRQNNSMDDLFSGGGHKTSTSGRSKNNLDQSRSKSNEPRRNMASTSNLNQKQKNSRAHASAPSLSDNKKRNTSNYDEDDDDDDEENEDYEVKDVTDDSDAE